MIRRYAYGIVLSARWVYLSTNLRNLSRAFKRVKQKSKTNAKITHLARETVPYAFSRMISDVLCTIKRFHNFIFHQSARWVYLGPGVKWGVCFGVREGPGFDSCVVYGCVRLIKDPLESVKMSKRLSPDSGFLSGFLCVTQGDVKRNQPTNHNPLGGGGGMFHHQFHLVVLWACLAQFISFLKVIAYRQTETHIN